MNFFQRYMLKYGYDFGIEEVFSGEFIEVWKKSLEYYLISYIYSIVR